MLKIVFLFFSIIPIFAEDILTKRCYDAEGTEVACTKSSSKSAFKDNGNGIVLDTSGLMWQNDYKDNKAFEESGKVPHLSHSEALKYCSAINLGGYNDWRLPIRRELRSLADYSKSMGCIKPAPAIVDVFISTVQTDDWYWSATDYEENTTAAWAIFFYNGYLGWNSKDRTGYVRCVRNL